MYSLNLLQFTMTLIIFFPNPHNGLPQEHLKKITTVVENIEILQANIRSVNKRYT